MTGEIHKSDKSDPAREQRGIITDAATTFLLSAAGGSGAATGAAAVEAVGNVFSDGQDGAELPAEVVLPPGVDVED